MERTVQLELGGMRFVLKTESPTPELRRAARLVDQKLQEVRGASRSSETQRQALLAALSLAGELLSEREARRNLRKQVREKTGVMLKALDRAQEQIVPPR